MIKSHDTKSDSLQQCFVSQTGLPFTNYQILPGGIIFSKYSFQEKENTKKYGCNLDKSHLDKNMSPTMRDPLLALSFKPDSLFRDLSGI